MAEKPYGIFTKSLYIRICPEIGHRFRGLRFISTESFSDETVADPWFGLDVLLAGFGLELFAQLAYEDAEIFRLMGRLGSPDRSEQGAMGDDFSGMAGQVEEEVEFLGSEMDGLAEHGDGVGVRVHYEVAGLNCGSGAFGCAAQVGADPGQ